jgi:1-acyl-sn-glycerol-3-phosphate acyltransferase
MDFTHLLILANGHPVLTMLVIILLTFILEDPTTLGVGALIASGKLSLGLGFVSLVVGIFLGDLGLYGLGFMMKRGFFVKARTFFKPTIFNIALARFLPGARTITFLASGFDSFPLKTFLLVIFPSSIIWTFFLLFFTEQILSILHFFPSWINWGIGVLLLVLLTQVKLILKLGSMILLIGSVIVHHGLIQFIFKQDPLLKKKLSHSLSRYSQLALAILGVEVKSNIKSEETQGKLLLSNHMSYLDVLCISSLFPTLYVTSVEIRETPILGLICELSGCLFTERRHARRSAELMERELKEVEGVLTDGFSLTLFPEGTSTNGSGILPFKTSLLEGALRGQVPIIPIVIRYEEIEGQKFFSQNCDVVCWYGKMNFFPHFIRLCRSHSIKVQVIALKPLRLEPEEKRKELGERARKAMEEVYLGRV